MPTWEEIRELKLKTGDVITEDWYDKLVDILNRLAFESAVDVYGYIHRDLVPLADAVFKIGTPERRLYAIHVVYAYVGQIIQA